MEAATNGTDPEVKVVVAPAKVLPQMVLTVEPIGVEGIKIRPELLEVTEIIRLATVLAIKLNFKDEVVEEVSVLSEKAKKIKRFIEKSDFNCRQKTVAGLMSLLLDEKIEVVEKKEAPEIKMIRGAIYVLTKNVDGHNYALGEPWVFSGYGRQGLRLGHSPGDHAGNNADRSLDSYRKPTREDFLRVIADEDLLIAVKAHLGLGGNND
jgi:hypothetical protein